MFSGGIIDLVHRGFLFLIYISALTCAVKIEKISVPEVVQSGSNSSVMLSCEYSPSLLGERFMLQWLFNGSTVYEWSLGAEPNVSGLLDGRLDLTLTNEARGVLHITKIDPELSGEYTCRIVGIGAEDRLTKTMLVFSPEKEFMLDFGRQPQDADLSIRCFAHGLYPQPELTIECNGMIYPKQQLRVWRSEGLLYDAESNASLKPAARRTSQQITCRLQIPQAGYIAIKKEMLISGHECGNCSTKLILYGVDIVIVLAAIVINIP